MEQHFKSKYVYIVIGLACILSCTSEKKQNRTISKDMLYGEWTLVGGEALVLDGIADVKEEQMFER